ncbi:MAG TPA: MarR family transcriptional regulator [Spirochaetia bacterium]|nr:MarR family transcriptional regulator [Spirochaetia bacterium]
MAESSWRRFLQVKGLTSAEFSVLAALRAKQGLTQRAVADSVGVDPRNVVATVARLTRRGLITHSPARRDGRAKTIALTARGLSRWETLELELRPKREAFFSPLTPTEMAELEHLLLKLHKGSLQ